MVDVTAPPAALVGSRKQRLPRLRAMPLRWRLLGVTLGLIAVALAVTSLVVSALLRAYLVNQTEQELDVYAASLASVDLAELQVTGSQLPSNFTAKVLDLATGKVTNLRDAALLEPTTPALPIPRITDANVLEPSTFQVDSAT